MQARFIGSATLIGWYGMDLIPNQVSDIPGHLAAKVENNPHMFEPVRKRARKAKDAAEDDGA